MAEAGEPHPQDALEDVFRELDAEAGAGRARGSTGVSLLLALAVRARQVPWDPDCLRRSAAFLGVHAAALDEVVAFTERMLASDQPLVLCRGTSCSLHGAADFHERVRSRLRALGARPQEVVVYCLDRCESGPSVLCGTDMYCAAPDRVMPERPSWRGNAGLVRLDDAGPAIRD